MDESLGEDNNNNTYSICCENGAEPGGGELWSISEFWSLIKFGVIVAELLENAWWKI